MSAPQHLSTKQLRVHSAMQSYGGEVQDMPRAENVPDILSRMRRVSGILKKVSDGWSTAVQSSGRCTYP